MAVSWRSPSGGDDDRRRGRREKIRGCSEDPRAGAEDDPFHAGHTSKNAQGAAVEGGEVKRGFLKRYGFRLWSCCGFGRGL